MVSTPCECSHPRCVQTPHRAARSRARLRPRATTNQSASSRTNVRCSHHPIDLLIHTCWACLLAAVRKGRCPPAITKFAALFPYYSSHGQSVLHACL